MDKSGTGFMPLDRLQFSDIWLLWRTGELRDYELAQFALVRPDFRLWFNQRRRSANQAPNGADAFHRASKAESLLTSRTSSGCRDK